MRDRSGRSGRRRGSQKPGTACGAASTLPGAGIVGSGEGLAGASGVGLGAGACAKAVVETVVEASAIMPATAHAKRAGGKIRTMASRLLGNVRGPKMSGYGGPYRPSSAGSERRFRVKKAAFRSKIMLQIASCFLGLAVHIEGRDEFAVAIHQIDQRGVVHGVVAVLQGNLLGVDPVFAKHLLDRRGIAGQTFEMRVEARQIVLHRGGGVPLGID